MNLDSANYPNREPEINYCLRKFRFWKRDDFVSDYDPNSYVELFPQEKTETGSTTFSITASESSTSTFVEVGSSTTANSCDRRLSLESLHHQEQRFRKVLVDEGIWEIVGNYASSTDDPPVAKTMVDNLETISRVYRPA